MAVQLIPGFTRLSFNVYISQPEKRFSNATTTETDAPDLILLHPWLNALPKNIAKYTVKYRTLYPTSTILLTTSSWHDWAYRSISSQNASLNPVVEYLLSLPPTSTVLLHLFSNGGAWTATQVSSIYRQKTGKLIPVSKMILDSTPGKYGYQRTTKAFAVSLPPWRKNPIWKLIGLIWIYVGIGMGAVIGMLLRIEEPTQRLRRDLNDKTLYTREAERLYIFGDKDGIIPSEHIIEHAVSAEAEGWKVSQERFVDGGHCMHAAVDPKRYWDAVDKLWKFKGNDA